MKQRIFTYLTSFLLALMPFSSVAQDLPVLKADPNIKKGVLNNGVNYYIATNKSKPSEADFLLVQKSGQCEHALCGSKYFPESSVQCFLERNNIVYDRNGYVLDTPDARIYRFAGVHLSPAKTDSLLLAITDIISRSPEVGNNRQAVVIAGDVNADDFIRKLSLLGLMVPKNKVEDAEKPYTWTPTASPAFEFRPDGRMLSYVSIEYSAPNVDRKLVNTVLPLMSGHMSEEFGEVLRRRLMRIYKYNHIPVAGIDVDVRLSGTTSSDEKFKVTVSTSREYVEDAYALLVETLADADVTPIYGKEYELTRTKMMHEDGYNIKQAKITNADMAERCVNAFLYNASLAADAEKYAFLQGRELPDTARLAHFDRYVKALVDRDANVIVRSNSHIDLQGLYMSSWQKAVDEAKKEALFAITDADTTMLPGPGLKGKGPKIKPDALTGGKLWTFPNGLKVVYKQQNTGGLVYYDFALGGGMDAVQGLKNGEGKFIPDILFCSKISGIPGGDFLNMLNAEGITMESSITYSRFCIEGHAPSNRLNLLMRSLLAIANERVGDRDAFTYYMNCEKLRLDGNVQAIRDRAVALDSIMCMGNRYSKFKLSGSLSDETFEKAELFFSNEFAQCNDGVIVIISDRSEDDVLKLIQPYTGRFRVNTIAAKRRIDNLSSLTGSSLYIKDGDRNSIDIVMTVPLQVTTANHALAELAVMAVKDAAFSAMKGTGYYPNAAFTVDVYPSERLGVMVTVQEALLSGLDQDEHLDPLPVLVGMRRELEILCKEKLSDARLKELKARLRNRVKELEASPEFWAEMAAIRYVDGKDLVSRYIDRVEAATAEQVRQLIEKLYNGGKVEYVVRNAADFILED